MPQVSLDQLIIGVASGHLISFPTDTVPALAAHPDYASLIFTTKQRDLDKPLILMAASLDDLWSYVTGSPAERQIWQQVAARHLPGALTLVLPASDRVPPTLNPKDPTSIGVRVPNHAIARAILAQTGALATTSANRSGEPALQTLAEIAAQFPQVLTLATTEATTEAIAPPTPDSQADPQLAPSLCNEPAEQPSGIPSTVARWTGTGWEILRQGAVILSP
jgi:L-threonylcarbamoyladenylate synthase